MNCTRIGVWVDIRYSDKHLQSHPHILCEYICVCLSTYSCVCTCMYTREHLLTYSRCLTVLNIILHTHPHEYTTIVSHIYIHTLYIHVYTVCMYVHMYCTYVFNLFVLCGCFCCSRTPLHWAAACERPETIRTLLEAGG